MGSASVSHLSGGGIEREGGDGGGKAPPSRLRARGNEKEVVGSASISCLSEGGIEEEGGGGGRAPPSHV